MQRNGFPFKLIVLGAFLVGTVYLMYEYNTTLGRLRDAETAAERYKRAEETRVAQLEEVQRSKIALRDTCSAEKIGLTRRLENLDQEHRSLKSNYDQLQTDQAKLQQELRRVREDCSQADTQREQEYQQFRQEKELQFSNLRDDVANANRHNDELEKMVYNLKNQYQQCQSKEVYDQSVIRDLEADLISFKQQLAQKDTQMLQQYQHQQQQQPFDNNINLNNNQQQPVDNINMNNNQQHQVDNINVNNNQQKGQLPNFDANVLHQQHLVQQQPQQDFRQQDNVANFNIMNGVDSNGAGVQGALWGHKDAEGVPGGLNDLAKQQEVNNELHQMQPPHNADQLGEADADDDDKDIQHPLHQLAEKDENHQVMPPDFNLNANVNAVKDDGADNDGDENEEEEEEEEDEEDAQQHNEDPLGLRPNLGDQAFHDDQGGQAKEDIEDVPQLGLRAGKQLGGNAAEEAEDKAGDEYEDGNYDDNDHHRINLKKRRDARNVDDDYH